MKKFKNLLALLLVLVTAVSFTACGKTHFDLWESETSVFSVTQMLL